MTREPSVPEMQRADPRARRAALIVVAAMLPVGLPLVWLTRSSLPFVGDWLTEDPARTLPRLRILALALSVALAVPTVALTAFLWRVGASIVQAERFPPPGVAMTRDTVVMRGAAARRRGRTIQLLAAAMALAAAGLIVVLWRLVAMLDVTVA